MASQAGHSSSAADRDVKLGRALFKELASSHGKFLSVDEQSWKNFYMRVFGRQPSGRMRDYFHRFPHIFSCEPDDNIPNSVIIRSKVSIELCGEHCSKDGCHRLGCEALHCCKFFICGTCKFGQKCRHGHDLTQPHNQRLLARRYLDGLSPKEIRVFVSQSFPTACKFYNNEGGCTKDDKCPHLHVCKHYLLDDCTFGRKRCKRSHNIYDSQPKKILTKYGIRTDCSPKEVLEQIRAALPRVSKQDSSRTDSETHTSDDGGDDGDDDDDELGAVGPAPLLSRRRTSSSSSAARESTEICTYFLWTKCNYGKSCANVHPKFPLPYQWQFKVDGEWKDFAKGPNDEIETVFCNPKNHECFIADPSFDGIVAINFDTMKCMKKNQDTCVVRRLSTRASKGQSSKHLFLTEWCWYWRDTREDRWIEFGRDEDINSEDLEEAFALNPNGHVMFMSYKGADFVADLETMKRTNGFSSTDIRRRPLLFDPETKRPGRKRHW